MLAGFQVVDTRLGAGRLVDDGFVFHFVGVAALVSAFKGPGNEIVGVIGQLVGGAGGGCALAGGGCCNCTPGLRCA